MNPALSMMGEGDTPLLVSRRIGPERGARRLYFKLESCNPSGSYKDRFIAAELSSLMKRGVRTCVATSSGNTGSALAAGCARFDMRCHILVNDDAPVGKLIQMQAHGAKVIRVPRFVSDPGVTDRVFAQLRAYSKSAGAALVVSAFRYCPEGMGGVERIAWELTVAFGGAKEIEGVFVPVGGGGLYSAVVQGFQKRGSAVPKVHVVQPAGCSTVAAAFARGEREVRPVTASTRVSGLSVPSDIDGGLALQRLRECGGTAFEASDKEIFAAQRLLMTQEGVYCEPAGAAALAGWLKARDAGVIDPSGAFVCLVTGHGFKDPVSVESAATKNPSRLLKLSEIDRLADELGAA